MAKKKEKRKFYRTVLKTVVLTEEPIPSGLSPTDILNRMDYDDYVGMTHTVVDNQVLSGIRTVTLLKELGSQPEFFNLDDDGNSLDDE